VEVGVTDIVCVEVWGFPGEVSLVTVEAPIVAVENNLDVEEVVATVRVLNILKWTMLKL
jgi:hypothetical protein